LTCVGILLLPMAVVVMYGRMLKRPREAAVIYGVMLALLVALVVGAVCWDSLQPNQALAPQPGRSRALHGYDHPAVAGLPVDQDGVGNLEGKELRFGPSAGATFSAVTTAVACGSVNCAHDSLNPLAGLVTLAGMWLSCVFGGKGVGMLNFLLYLIVGVFITGLMVGRTPEYLGKKVEAREMKLA